MSPYNVALTLASYPESAHVQNDDPITASTWVPYSIYRNAISTIGSPDVDCVICGRKAD